MFVYLDEDVINNNSCSRLNTSESSIFESPFAELDTETILNSSCSTAVLVGRGGGASSTSLSLDDIDEEDTCVSLEGPTDAARMLEFSESMRRADVLRAEHNKRLRRQLTNTRRASATKKGTPGDGDDDLSMQLSNQSLEIGDLAEEEEEDEQPHQQRRADVLRENLKKRLQRQLVRAERASAKKAAHGVDEDMKDQSNQSLDVGDFTDEEEDEERPQQ